MTKARKGASPLDIAMAALAAASVGFAVFAMPGPVFNDAVALSGLPMLLPAANPPLGMTARLAVLAVAAIATFVLVYLVLRSLGRKPSAPRRRVQIEEIEVAPPKLRRADAHPDAPSRRPILAGLDLGEPMPADEPEEAASQPATAEAEEPATAEAEESPAAFPSFLLPDQPAEAEEPAAADEPLAQAQEQQSDQLAAAEQPAEAAADPDDHATISHLMERLERGLVQRESGDRARAPGAAPARQSGIDERLRSAISDLQRLTARHG